MLILPIILNLIIPNFIYETAELPVTSSSEEFAIHFLQTKMNILISKNTDELDKYYFLQAESSKKYMLYTKIELLQDYLIPYSSNDYEIKKVIPHVKIISKNTSDNTATIEAALKTYIYWNASNALGSNIIGIKSENHKFVLKKAGKKWKVFSDQYMTDRGYSDNLINEDLSELNNTAKKLKKEAADLLIKSKKSMQTRLILTEAYINNATDSIYDKYYVKKRPTSSVSYNRNEAYNWAHTHWNNYSPAYQNFGDSNYKGGDCTNFVSQCIRAGGAKNDKKGEYHWYYDNNGSADTSDDSYSWTWSTARGLNYILLGNYKTDEYGPKGTEKKISGDIQYDSTIGQFVSIGDIIQYQWKADMKITHSAIIVGMLYNSSKERYEPVISTHTSDSWYIPWSRNAYKTYFIHITGIN